MYAPFLTHITTLHKIKLTHTHTPNHNIPHKHTKIDRNHGGLAFSHAHTLTHWSPNKHPPKHVRAPPFFSAHLRASTYRVCEWMRMCGARYSGDQHRCSRSGCTPMIVWCGGSSRRSIGTIGREASESEPEIAATTLCVMNLMTIRLSHTHTRIRYAMTSLE